MSVNKKSKWRPWSRFLFTIALLSSIACFMLVIYATVSDRFFLLPCILFSYGILILFAAVANLTIYVLLYTPSDFVRFHRYHPSLTTFFWSLLGLGAVVGGILTSDEPVRFWPIGVAFAVLAVLTIIIHAVVHKKRKLRILEEIKGIDKF